MLLAQHDLGGQRTSAADRRREERRIPRKQHGTRAHERPRQSRVLPNGIEKQKCSQSEREGQRNRKRARPRTLTYRSFNDYWTHVHHHLLAWAFSSKTL